MAFSLITGPFHGAIAVFDLDVGVIATLTGAERSGVATPGVAAEMGRMDDSPVWSPDSGALAFARSELATEEPATTLMRVERAGGAPREIARLGPPEPFIVAGAMHWLPDDTLLFAIYRSGPRKGQNGIWRIGTDGDDPRQLTSEQESGELGLRIVAVAPDGERASVYAGSRLASGVSQADVYALLDTASGKLTPVSITAEEGALLPAALVGEIVAVSPPRFSPDGTTAIFAVGTPESDASWLTFMDVGTGEQAMLGLMLYTSPVTSFQGFQWAANNTVLAISQHDIPVLLTLERVGSA
ncbi:MAG: PD40 domain-containing protein [Chloroflexia bacterium]|nr:PD40 domain-containing protein [Chloroflexia bacterium]